MTELEKVVKMLTPDFTTVTHIARQRYGTDNECAALFLLLCASRFAENTSEEAKARLTKAFVAMSTKQ